MDENEADVLQMKKIATGDFNAARDLVLKWQKPLINFFYRSVNNVHSAEDLAQQTFVKVCRSAKNYVPSATFAAYLFRVAHNVLVSDYRMRSRRHAVPTDPSELPPIEDTSDAVAENELRESFAKAVEELPDNQRTAILLLCQQGLAYAEIAEAMNASIPTIKTWIHRARQSLRESLAGFLDD